MTIDTNNEKCSGCKACEQVCPKNAIRFVFSKKGFLIPKIENDKCIDCGRCFVVCQCVNDVSSVSKEVKAFAAIYENEDVLKISQSGGLFYGLAEKMLGDDGIVYGAAVCENNTVNQIRVDNFTDLWRIQGSKYVQSDTSDTFSKVCSDLKDGKKVLYGGTSCMIDGLYRFLMVKKMDVRNLITCDLICHGVVSPKLYRQNLLRIEKQKKKRIVHVNFRDKKFGWHSHIETYTLEDDALLSENYYTELFYSHVALRDCCYDCQFSALEHKPADITMADFWGIEKTIPDIKDNNTGISLAVTRSDKGEEFLIGTKLKLTLVDTSRILLENRGGSIRKPYIYQSFWKDYFRYGYKYCLKKYTIYGGILFKIKRRLLKIINRW